MVKTKKGTPNGKKLAAPKVGGDKVGLKLKKAFKTAVNAASKFGSFTKKL